MVPRQSAEERGRRMDGREGLSRERGLEETRDYGLISVVFTNALAQWVTIRELPEGNV